MLQRFRLIALLTIICVAATATVASADRGHGGAAAKATATERLFTLQPDPAGNPEGVAFDRRSKAFFVSITADGAIYRGRLGSDTVSPFIDGAPGQSAIGIKVRHGKLYVAGGPTGSITVYDIATGERVAQFQTGSGGFLNDLVVTGRGDVFVTDSFRPLLWHVTAEQVRAGSGTPEGLDVSAIPYDPGQFNLNGIVNEGGGSLVVVDSDSGKLFRIVLSDDRSSIESIDELEGATVTGGDGLLRDRGRLVVVQGNPAQLAFVKLDDEGGATLVGTRTSDLLRGPSTVARARGLYLVVNADFVTSQRPFTVAGLPR